MIYIVFFGGVAAHGILRSMGLRGKTLSRATFAVFFIACLSGWGP